MVQKKLMNDFKIQAEKLWEKLNDNQKVKFFYDVQDPQKNEIEDHIENYTKEAQKLVINRKLQMKENANNFVDNFNQVKRLAFTDKMLSEGKVGHIRNAKPEKNEEHGFMSVDDISTNLTPVTEIINSPLEPVEHLSKMDKMTVSKEALRKKQDFLFYEMFAAYTKKMVSKK